MQALCRAIIITLLTAVPAVTSGTAVTPAPAAGMQLPGAFRLTAPVAVEVNAPSADADRLTRRAQTLPWVAADAPKPAGLRLNLRDTVAGVDSPEGYRLRVTADGIDIDATHGAGLFHGLTTLEQLETRGDSIRAVEITDSPRFGWRGVMLDISRHFRDKEFIKKQIDAMALLKLNRLHLHLTDAAGWRVQIDRYPRLTEYAAWRPALTWKEWRDGGYKYAEHTDPLAQGGYLTKDDVRDIVAYAADRYITVVPEIEMPSHSEEVMAAYPELGCTGVKQADFCVGNPATFEFLENVLDEICELFPGEYIHIGGDEASMSTWKDCPRCSALMEKEGLETPHDLQTLLVNHIETYLNGKGRKMVGWHEILNPRLSTTATVMCWGGEAEAIEAARRGNDVVMSPGAFCYFDAYQDAPPSQPEAMGGYTPLDKVYGLEPVPEALTPVEAARIAGVQGNLWCEFIPTAQHAEYMLYPRLTAIAEIGWSDPATRDRDDFRRRAAQMNRRLQSLGFHVFDIEQEAGQRRESVVDAVHKGVGKKVTYNVPWWNKYEAGGDSTLTDGRRGGWGYGDRRWQGFMDYESDRRLDVTIDLGEVTPIEYVGADFMQLIEPDIWFPARVTIYASTDGKKFRKLTEIVNEQAPLSGLRFKTFAWEGSDKARYVRYVATAPKGCQFTDEIVIR